MRSPPFSARARDLPGLYALRARRFHIERGVVPSAGSGVARAEALALEERTGQEPVNAFWPVALSKTCASRNPLRRASLSQLDKSSRGMQHGETGRCDRKGDRSVFRKATDPVTSLQLGRETGPRRRLLRRARQTGTGRPPT